MPITVVHHFGRECMIANACIIFLFWYIFKLYIFRLFPLLLLKNLASCSRFFDRRKYSLQICICFAFRIDRQTNNEVRIFLSLEIRNPKLFIDLSINQKISIKSQLFHRFSISFIAIWNVAIFQLNRLKYNFCVIAFKANKNPILWIEIENEYLFRLKIWLLWTI